MSATDALRAYCAAFAAKDAEAVLLLFAEGGLFEWPLLGQRLAGRPEIGAGLARIFALVERSTIEIAALRASGPVAIAEGTLRAKLHRDPGPIEVPLALVVRLQEGEIARLSAYLDARPYRLWADGPIFVAAATPAARMGGTR